MFCRIYIHTYYNYSVNFLPNILCVNVGKKGQEEEQEEADISARGMLFLYQETKLLSRLIRHFLDK